MIEKVYVLYIPQNADKLLFCTCLPRVVQLEHLQVSLNFLEDNYEFWKKSHKQNIINLTRQILNSYSFTGFLFLTQGACISIIPSRCGYFLIDSHSRNSNGMTDPEGSAMLLRFQNVVELSKYIIETYDRIGSSLQYEIQQLLVETNGIPEKEKRRVVSSHEFEYQHAVILNNQNKRKKEKQAQGISKGTPSKKRILSFLGCLKFFENKIEQGPCYICVICNRTFYKKLVRIFKSNYNDLAKFLATNV